MESDKKKQERPPHPREKANLFSIATFGWVKKKKKVNLLIFIQPSISMMSLKIAKTSKVNSYELGLNFGQKFNIR